MADYTMAQAKRDFDRGYLLGFELQRVPMGAGWGLNLFEKGDGLRIGHQLVDARTKRVRFFKTADAAIRAAEQIGFRFNFLASGALA